jgi:carbon storage regulator
MLVLSRKRNERIIIEHAGVSMTVTVVEVRGDKVGLGFEAPPAAIIKREELLARPLPNREAKQDA